MIQSCRNTHIAIIQCQYADLGWQLSQALKINSPELSCLSTKAEIIDAYLDIMYCYQTLPVALICFGTYDTTGLTSQQISSIITAFANTGLYEVDFDSGTQTLYIYSYNAMSSLIQINSILSGVLGITVTAIDQSSNVGLLLDFWNCLTYDQFCGIINSAYSILASARSNISTTTSQNLIDEIIPPIQIIPLHQSIVATAGQTIFPTIFFATLNSIVYIDGILATSGYSIIAGVVTFANEQPEGSTITVYQW